MRRCGQIEASARVPQQRFVMPTIMIRRSNAEEIADRIPGVTAQRVRELALAGYMPCDIGDDGEPYFKINEAVNWAKNNLSTRVKGKSLPVNLRVVTNYERASMNGRPHALRAINNLELYEHQKYPSCVYFLTLGGKIQYVGQSTFLPSRIQNHEESAKEFDAVYFIRVPREILDDVEAALIAILDPPLNRQTYCNSAKGADFLRDEGVLTIELKDGE